SARSGPLSRPFCRRGYAVSPRPYGCHPWCPKGQAKMRTADRRADSSEASGCFAPVTRSLPAALPGRDGLVHCLMDAEDLHQPGDLEDLQDPLLGADQIQRAVVRPHPVQAAGQHPEAGGVEEPDLLQVDDEVVVVLAGQLDEQLTQPRRRIDIDLALDVDDLDAVPGVVTQLQIHKSSSAVHGVISASIPAPRAGVARAGRDPLLHSTTLRYHSYTSCLWAPPADDTPKTCAAATSVAPAGSRARSRRYERRRRARAAAYSSPVSRSTARCMSAALGRVYSRVVSSEA